MTLLQSRCLGLRLAQFKADFGFLVPVLSTVTMRNLHVCSGETCSQCVDDQQWSNTIGDGCSEYRTDGTLHALCGSDVGVNGAAAKLACPVSCGTACAADFNECLSAPCRNGGTCEESSTQPSVAIGAFRCKCANS